MSGCCDEFVPGSTSGGGGGGVSGVELENEGAAVAGGPFTTLNSLNVGIIFSNDGPGVGGVEANPPYVDLRFPPYNVVANDPTPAVAAANTAGINAAILAFTGTDACLALPQGDIYVDQAAVSANWSIIFGTGISRLTLMGWGKRGTRIVQNGDGDLGEWDAILIDGASDIELKNFGVLQGTITNPDPGQQNHLIVVANNILGGTTQNIVCHDLWFGKCLGDGFRLLSDNAGDVVENIELRDCEMELNGIVNVPSGRVGARSGIALQRGWRDVRIINVKISGAQNSAFDSEPTGPVGIIVDTLLIDGMEIDNTLGNTNSPCSVAGNLNERLKNITIRNLKIFGGKLEVRNVDNTLFENPSIETTVPPAADVTDALITIRGVNVNGLTFINPIVNRLGTSAAGRCIDSDGAITDLLTIEGGVSRQGTASYPILLNGCTTLVIRNHEARYSSATSPAGISMVLLSMTDSNCQPTIDGLIARSTHATKFRGVIDSQVRAPRTLSNPQYINIDAPNIAEWGVITGVGVAAVNDPSPLIEDNNWGTQTIAWKSEDAGENPTTTLYPIVSGNKGTLTSRRIEGLTTPNGNVVGNLGDAYVWRPTTTTAERWFKATETVAGTPDNTGWVLANTLQELTITPALTLVTPAGTVDNYNPAGLADFTHLRLDTTAGAVNFTGFAAQNDGDVRIVQNLGPNDATLAFEDGGSLAANRFATVLAPGVSLDAGVSVIIMYDATLARWIVLAMPWGGTIVANYAIISKLRVQGTITPAALPAGATNDYALTVPESTSRYLIPTNAAGSTLTGMVAQNNGDFVWITNTGPGLLTFTNEDAGSVAANRYTLPGALPLVIKTNGTVMFVYDTATSRWRPYGAVGYSTLNVDNLTVNIDFNGDGTNDLFQTRFSGYVARNTATTPAALGAGTTNDYDLNPSLSNSNRIRQATNAANSALSGMVSNGINGAEWLLKNLGPGTLTLLAENAGSAAANRFELEGGVDRVIGVGGVVLISYDNASTRWNCLG